MGATAARTGRADGWDERGGMLFLARCADEVAPHAAPVWALHAWGLSQGDTVISSATRPDPWVPEDAADTDPPRVLRLVS